MFSPIIRSHLQVRGSDHDARSPNTQFFSISRRDGRSYSAIVNDDAILNVDATHRSQQSMGPPMKNMTLAISIIGLTIAFAPEAAAKSFDALRVQMCREDARAYKELLQLRSQVTPAQVAEAYIEHFATQIADREAQAVWRRMLRDDTTLEAALETHLDRYHADKTDAAKAELKANVAKQIDQLKIIHTLVLDFENAPIDPEFAVDVLYDSWKQSDAPKPLDHYAEMLRKRAKSHEAKGNGPVQAAARAGVDVLNARERDRGVSPGIIYDEGDPCYPREVAGYEFWLRTQALEKAGHVMTADQIRELGKESDLLSYYTHYVVGPRHYSLDRLKAWREAARGASQ